MMDECVQFDRGREGQRAERIGEFKEHITPCSFEKQEHGWGLRAPNLIGQDNVKCYNIWRSTAKIRVFESNLCSTVFKYMTQLK